MKKQSPKKVAAAVADALKTLAKAAKANHRKTSKTKRAAETALAKLGRVGVEGDAALSLIGAVVERPFAVPCKRCDTIKPRMSGELCVDCAIKAERAAFARQLS